MVAGEAINPRKNIPLAVMISIAGVSCLYVLAAISLTGMVPYAQISATSGFAAAFEYNGMNWAAQLTALGEVCTLPLVILVSLMAQPRLLFALAKDGLLPVKYASMDENGNLLTSIKLSGAISIFIATFIPFAKVNDMISAGVLLCFCLTDSSLIVLRCSTTTATSSVEHAAVGFNVLLFNVFAFIACLLFVHGGGGGSADDAEAANTEEGIQAMGVIGLLVGMLAIHQAYKLIVGAKEGGGGAGAIILSTVDHFQIPFSLMPVLPLFGIFCNYYLLAQLEMSGLLYLTIYFSLVTLYYVTCVVNKTSIANGVGWMELRDLSSSSSSVGGEGGGQQHLDNSNGSSSGSERAADDYEDDEDSDEDDRLLLQSSGAVSFKI
jgi:APA family basic amino acid/polyamine antiporter